MAKAIIDVRDLSEEDVLKVEQFIRSLRENALREKKKENTSSGAAKESDDVKGS